MKKYNLRFKNSIDKDVRRIPASTIERILQRIESLVDNPYPHGFIKLSGSENMYRIRVGEYRIIYSLDMQKAEIIIQHIRHRRDAYRDF